MHFGAGGEALSGGAVGRDRTFVGVSCVGQRTDAVQYSPPACTSSRKAAFLTVDSELRVLKRRDTERGYILGSFGSGIRIRALGLLPTLFSRSSFIAQDGRCLWVRVTAKPRLFSLTWSSLLLG